MKKIFSNSQIKKIREDQSKDFSETAEVIATVMVENKMDNPLPLISKIYESDVYKKEIVAVKSLHAIGGTYSSENIPKKIQNLAKAERICIKAEASRMIHFKEIFEKKIACISYA